MASPSKIEGRLADRAVVRLSPAGADEDVREFLQGLVTQDTAQVAPGKPLWTALLSPQGKCLFDFFLFADRLSPADILIDCEAERSGALVKRLSLYRLRRKIDIVPDNARGVFWNSSGGAHPDPRLPILGQRWIGEAGSQDTDVSEDYRKHRLSLGVTEGVAELGDGQTLWLECNAIELNGVSFTKGCYVGQENTARMNWRAKINRRMVVVPMAQADEKRQKAAYPGIGFSVEHRRIADLGEIALPGWLRDALSGDA